MVFESILLIGVGAVIGSVTTEMLQRARGKRDELKTDLRELRSQVFELTRRLDTLRHIEGYLEQEGRENAAKFFRAGDKRLDIEP